MDDVEGTALQPFWTDTFTPPIVDYDSSPWRDDLDGALSAYTPKSNAALQTHWAEACAREITIANYQFRWSEPFRIHDLHIDKYNGSATGGPLLQSANALYEPEVAGFLGSTRVAAFPDSGSSRNVISQDFAQRNRIAIKKSKGHVVRTAAGSRARTIGTVSLPFRFAQEMETYLEEFHVLPKCRYDVILGNPFLQMTKTFSKFTHRVSKRLRDVLSRRRVCFTGLPQQMLGGWADGDFTFALPDTGSDICLMSLAYANSKGYRINTNPKHRMGLEFVDGSTAEALGRVESFKWRFGLPDTHAHCPDVYVLEGLQTDLILSYDFLMSSNAFTAHEQSFVENNSRDSVEAWMVNAIKVVTPSELLEIGRSMARQLGWKLPSRPESGMSDFPDSNGIFADC